MEFIDKSYVRVSEILSRLQSFDNIPRDILEAKQNIGVNVHTAIKDDIQGEFPVVSSKELGYLRSFERWREQIDPIFNIVEKRFYDDKLKITGQIDAVVRFKGHNYDTLIDWKTSAQQSEAIWTLQAHFYHYLLKVNGVENLENRFLFVKLDKTGALPKVYEYKYDQNLMNLCFAKVEEYWRESSPVSKHFA